MKKIMSILTIFVIGILVLSGVGVATITSNKATTERHIAIDNQPPYAPKITGPAQVRPGTYEYTFNATDPDGDNVSYYIQWGDGHETDWFGLFESGEEITRSHKYRYIGTVCIQAKAKDIHGAISDWGTLKVTISKSKQIINLISFPFISRFIERFQMIK